jgi:YVTN family beta-propeller protein
VAALACGLTGLVLAAAPRPAVAQDCAYVGNQLVGQVRVLTIPDGREVSVTTLPGCSLGFCQLTDIVVEPESKTAFVSQLDGNRVWVVETAEAEGSTEPVFIAVASAPTDLALTPDASRLYVISLGTAEVVAIDANTRSEIGRFATPSQPRGLALSPDGSHIVTTSRDQNLVFVLDAGDGATAQMGAVGERPLAVALAPDGDRAFVAGETGSLTVVDVGSGETLDTFVVGQSPAAVAVSADGQTVYVANSGDDSVSVIDVDAREVATVGVGRSPVGLAITADGILLVANLQGGTLSVIDTNSDNAVLEPIPAGVSPFALTAAPCPEGALSTPTSTPVDTPDVTPMGTPTPAGPADVNCDGRIDEDDLSTMVRRIFDGVAGCLTEGVTAADLPRLIQLIAAATATGAAPE